MTCYPLPLLAGLLLTILHSTSDAFNVDVVNYVRHDGPSPDSMYGFSVALHREQQTSWVIIGAPKADTSRIQQNVQRGGAVYRCNSNDDNRCWLVPFDSKGSWHNDAGMQLDTKSNQWFGATVASAGIDGPIVACAPRYVFHTTNPSRLTPRVEPVGTCFVARDNFQMFTEFSPCRTSAWGYHRQGSCQAGFSAAITSDRLFIGAPGSWYWQGQEYSIDNQARYPYWPPRKAEYGEGQSFSHSIRGNPRDRVYSTSESSIPEDDTYMGYSSASGDFTGDGQRGVAVGMPRGGQLRGKVLLYTWNMTNLQNITGEQIGAYFGYSLCVVDVDGDRLDDLVIGAPMYTDPNNEGKYEMGRVYVMFQGKYNKFQELVTRDGSTSRGRFGLSLTTLGDINQDGFGDFAVGAPYDGPRGRGAVYIFHGSADGPLAKHSQVIYAEDIMVGLGEPLSTFGFSVAGGIDLDGNQYPDLVVGAYESNKAITFKSRPVAVMDASTTFEAESKLISLDNKSCTIGRGSEARKVACTVVNSCLTYNGVNLPTLVDIDVSWVLDVKKYRTPRMFFLNDEGRNIRNSTMRLYRGKTQCLTEQVYLTDSVRDKLTPLEVEMKYSIRGQQQGAGILSRQPRSLAGPVLDQNRGTMQRDAINIQKNCGPDNVCVPDLRLDIKTVDKYLLGSKDLLVIEVIIPNNGEDAFEAAFYMNIPPGMNFRKMERIGEARDGLITCTAPSAATNNTLKCDIGNPLPRGKRAHFKLVLMPALKPGQSPSYEFHMQVNSTNAESDTTIFDNIIQKNVHIWVETDLRVTGVAVEPSILYNISEYAADATKATHEEQLGPHIVNMFEIRNNGPSAIQESEIYLVIPHETLAGDRLMYLLNQPETSGNIQCDPTVLVNPQALQLSPDLARTSFLETQGAVESHSSEARTSSSSSSTSTSSTSSSSGSKFGAADFAAASGDASHIHQQRQNEAASNRAAAVAAGGTSSGRSASWSSQSSAHSANGGPVITYAASHNRSSEIGADGQLRTVYEQSTEYSSAGGKQYSANQQRSGVSSVGSATSSSTRHAQQNQHQSNQQSQQGRQFSAGFTGSGTSGQRVSLEDLPSEVRINHQHDLTYGSADRYAAANAAAEAAATSVASSASSTGGRRRMHSLQDSEIQTDSEHNLGRLALGGGLKTSVLEIVGRNNVDDELRQRGAQHIQNQQHSGQQHQSSSWSTNEKSSGSSLGKAGYEDTGAAGLDFDEDGETANGEYNEYEEDYEVDAESEDATGHNAGQYQSGTTSQSSQNQQQQQHSQSSHSSHSSSKSNSANSGQSTAANYQSDQLRHYPRQRRSPTIADLELNDALQCNRTRCMVLKCRAGPLPHNGNAWIAIRARLVAQTVHLLAPSVPMNLSTMVVARVSKLPYIGAPQEQPLKKYEVVTTVVPIPEPKPDVVPLWVVVLSACAGVLILLLLIFLLYKCGFFNRNRPTDSQERQPLNRNNGYHGDEHL